LPEATTIDRPVILLATPCFGGLVHQSYMLSVCKLMRAAEREGFTLDLALLGSDALITRSRSVLVATFLDMPKATHLLFVDADIAFEPEQMLRLLRLDVDFAAAFYPLKSVDWDALPARAVAGEPLRGAGLTYVGTLLEPPLRRTREGFATAKYAGTGFQLIRRAVFERLVAAHPELRFKSTHTIAREAPRGDNLYALFECQIDPETGEYLSEDYAFCRRWRALGGDIWLDLESSLTHVGADHFRGDTTTRFKDVSAGPAPPDVDAEGP
jgi:hypothetical protein